jgi:hypothetical protein
MTYLPCSSFLSVSVELSRLSEDSPNSSVIDTRKRDLGREAEELFRELRKELAVMLDITIENQEAIPSADLWADFEAALKDWYETLEIFYERMGYIAGSARRIQLEETDQTAPR